MNLVMLLVPFKVAPLLLYCTSSCVRPDADALSSFGGEIVFVAAQERRAESAVAEGLHVQGE